MKPQARAVDMFLFKYRGILPPLFLIAALGLQINFAVFARGADLPNIALISFGLFGLGIRIFAIGYAGTNTSGRNIIGHVADSLNTTGIYSICRNPLYLGNFFLWLACVMAMDSVLIIGLFFIAFWWFYSRIIQSEEAFLMQKFGTEYSDYRATIWRIVPNILTYRRGQTRFDMMRVFHQESGGLLAFFIAFIISDKMDILLGGAFVPRLEDAILLAGFGLSLCLYGVLRCIKPPKK